MASNLLLLRRLSRLLKPPPSLSSIPATRVLSLQVSEAFCPSSAAPSHPSGNFCSHSFNLNDGSQGPSPIDYRSLMQEDNFHRLANATIHYLQEKFEEYGDIVQIDGFDVDYGNEVLTLKVGPLGTYVLNKQTPNRQIWLSSPVSGPSRFDWDESSEAWVYRRTRANLTELLENELEKLCGQPIALS